MGGKIYEKCENMGENVEMREVIECEKFKKDQQIATENMESQKKSKNLDF